MSTTKGTISTSANLLGVDFEWRIDDFLSLSEAIRGTIYSPAFYFDGHIWFLHIFPNGCSDRDSSGHVDLDLFRYSSGPPTQQECFFSVKTANGKQYQVHGTEVYQGWNTHEFNRFVSKSELSRRRSELLPYDALTVVCTMNWGTSSGCGIPVDLPEEHDWVTDASDFLKEGRGVDVTFELETPSSKTEFTAHQLILAVRSPYFADAFYGTERNKGHLMISFKGIDPKAFEQMIRYCCDYKPCLRTIEDACALFKVAFEFKVLSLQKLCRTFIRDSKIEAGNVFCVLEVSEQMEDKSLGDICNKILQDKTRDVMATYELCDVTPVMVHTFLNLRNLSLNSEYELIKWIFDWAKVKSEDKDSSSENAREYLERWLKDMNFLTLTMEEFAVLHKDNPEFFSSDEIASICLNVACPGTREMPSWYDNNVKCRVYAGSKE